MVEAVRPANLFALASQLTMRVKSTRSIPLLKVTIDSESQHYRGIDPQFLKYRCVALSGQRAIPNLDFQFREPEVGSCQTLEKAPRPKWGSCWQRQRIEQSVAAGPLSF